MKRSAIYIFSIFALVNLFLIGCSPKDAAPTLVSTSLPDASRPGECTKIGQTWVSPLDGVILVCVPASEFLMGAGKDDPLAQDNEKPQHKVYLDAYWIDSTEVTNANFGKCLAAGACHPKVYETTAKNYIPYAIHPDYQNHPAFLYESEPAAEYCQWAGRRLPQEAEWEKAARGTDARLYPWGNTLDCTQANYFVCEETASKATPDRTGPRCGYSSSCKTTPVNAYPTGASPYGALNMAGNVWEWVADWYQADYYTTSPVNNPGGPTTGEYSWNFIYAVKPFTAPQIGLLNSIVVAYGGQPQAWTAFFQPWNNFFLIAIVIWLQTGYSMVLLSAAIKGIAPEIMEAARVDGANEIQLFFWIMIPQIMGSIIAVSTTIIIFTLKIFDVVWVMTGGQYGTSVIATEFYRQYFTYNNNGIGSTIAVLLFIAVIPVMVYNVRRFAEREAFK